MNEIESWVIALTFLSPIAGLVACKQSSAAPPATPGLATAAASSGSVMHPRSFAEAVHSLETTLHDRALPMVLENGEPVSGPVMFRVSNGRSFVLDFHDRMLAGGAFLFLAERGFERTTDLLGLAPTTDQFEVVRMVGTTGNGLHDNAQVIAWLRDLNRTQPLALYGMGYDFVEGVFLDAIRDPPALAHNINTFVPDFVSQGLGLFKKGPPEELIVDYFASERVFFFWWD